MDTLVSRQEWLVARKALLEKEKEMTRLQDELAHQRQQLPLVQVEKDYRFQTNRGEQTLLELFGDSRQLIVYHFMFGPDWERGCPSCSFWADNFNGIDAHLRARDTQLIAVSNAGLNKVNQFKKRLGWEFDWVSAEGNTFSADFGVSFYDGDQSDLQQGYNYSNSFHNDELPGISTFYRLDNDLVAYSYSCFARGLEIANTAYGLLDLTHLGRHEGELSYPMAWVKHRDNY